MQKTDNKKLITDFTLAYNALVDELEEAHATLAELVKPYVGQTIVKKTDGYFIKKIADKWNDYRNRFQDRTGHYVVTATSSYSVFISTRTYLDDYKEYLELSSYVLELQHRRLESISGFDYKKIDIETVMDETGMLLEAQKAYKKSKDRFEKAVPHILREALQRQYLYDYKV